MKTVEEYFEEIASLAEDYRAGENNPDKFFDASERILDICKNISEAGERTEEKIIKKLDDGDEFVRRTAAFCLLEFFAPDAESAKRALSVVISYIDASEGIYQLVWLAWLRAYEKRSGADSKYRISVDISPLENNYADKWISVIKTNGKKNKKEAEAFITKTPAYPFDLISFESEYETDESDDSSQGELPY